MSVPDTPIRARRKLTNRLIAAREAARLGPHFTEDAVMIVGDGAVIQGRESIVAAFRAQFSEPSFVSYVRTTEAVEFAADGKRAAERGRWVGTWTSGVEVSGVYAAAWREIRGQWLLERELYVSLRS